MGKFFLKRLLIVIVGLIIGFSVLGACIYSWVWFTYVDRVQVQINNFYHTAKAEYQLTLSGDIPKIDGYPLLPHLNYSGSVSHPSGFILDIPNLSYRGFPAPNQLQSFNAPQGLTLNTPMFGRKLELSNLKADIVLPQTFPQSVSYNDMVEWQKKRYPIIIRDLTLTTKSNVHLTGVGVIGLDDKLQIAGTLNARIVGMDTLLNDVDNKSSEIARGFLKMLSQTDEKTGEVYFATTLKIQDESFYLGPIRFATIPKLNWEGETQSSISTPRIKPE